MGLFQGPRPDITPPQLVAMVIAGIPILATLLRAFGVYDLSVEQQKALNDAVTWAAVFAGALIGGDAVLRTGRNIRKGHVEAALVSDPSQNAQNVVVDESILTPTTPVGVTTATAAPSSVNPATKLPNP